MRGSAFLRRVVPWLGLPFSSKLSIKKPASLYWVTGMWSSTVMNLYLPLTFTLFLTFLATRFMASPASLYERSLMQPPSVCSMSMAVWVDVGIKLFPSVNWSKVSTEGSEISENKISPEFWSVSRVWLSEAPSNVSIPFSVMKASRSNGFTFLPRELSLLRSIPNKFSAS